MVQLSAKVPGHQTRRWREWDSEMDMDGQAAPGLQHLALFYQDTEEYVSAIAAFVSGFATRSAPSFIAIPGDRHAKLRQALPTAAPVAFADICDLGRNPARIMPAIQAFTESAGGQPSIVVGEPIWPGRSPAEICEATRHEALVNLAFDRVATTIICPYDTAKLPREVIADARRTHPQVTTPDGPPERSRTFSGAGSFPAGCDRPLARVPPAAQTLCYNDSLRELRGLIADYALRVGLSQAKAVDFVLAASEVAANTLRHTDASGTLSLWQADGELICQLRDSGHITDPLAGRRSPNRDHPGGQGLWLVNQVCDLVEVRSGTDGTVVRLHMGVLS
jgi:anti-sigma regulatory factor (Ser/Thr protein kinase)